MSNSMTMSQFAVLALCFLWGVRGLRTDNPPMQLGKTAVKTVGQLARTQVKGQGFKGFKGFKGTGFQFKPQTLNGFAHAPSYAFNGFRSQTGQLGRGFGTFGGQMGRMPMGTMQNTMARRFASTGAQVSKGVELLTFQNWPPGLKARIVSAVEVAVGKSTRQQMGQAIREAFWPMFRFPNNDVHVLISRGEMAFANAATEGGVARFKIRHGGQDLFITLFKRNAKAINGGQALNYGHGTRSDLDILRSFGKGLYDLQNIFQPQSVEWIFKQTQEVFSKGLSPDKMAQRLESLMHQTYGGGWNVIVSPNKITAVVHERDVKAAFKVADHFVTFLRRQVSR